MRRITLREFRLNSTKYLEELGDGLVLTVYEKDKCMVVPMGYTPENEEPIKKATPSKFLGIKIPDEKERDRKDKCVWIGCHKDAVGKDKVSGRPLCEDHI